MAARRIYLDNNATTALDPAAAAAMRAAWDLSGNPSSPHAEGRAARRVVEDARRAVARALGAEAEAVVFTSGGTEGANALLSPEWTHPRGLMSFSRLLVGASEHPCVLHGGRFPPSAVERLPVDADGRVDRDALRARLAEGAPALVAVQFANGETGVLQDVAGIAADVRAAGGFVVCDAVQGFGKRPIDLGALGVDALFVSAHKAGGPQGVGAIAFARPGVAPAAALLGGGGQQRGLRSGTENVAGIAGFGAVAARIDERIGANAHLSSIRDRFERTLRALAPGVTVFGAGAARLANTCQFAIPGEDAASLLIALDLAGFAVSSGSACSSGKVRRSHVLEAMGVPDALSRGAIRVSFRPADGDAEADALIAALAKRIAGARRGIDPAAADAA
jgi:cysteine desulfurase